MHFREPVFIDLGSSEGVSHGNVSAKGEDGDEYRSGGPDVNTNCIQILSALQTLQLQTSTPHPHIKQEEVRDTLMRE